MAVKKIGLLLGDETDWPAALEGLLSRFQPQISFGGATWRVEIERIRIRPFALGHTVPYDVVLDRLSHWHFQPRQWLKKAALVDDTYLLNNPFTFQCFDKHAAYAAMHRLGLPIPQTWLLPVAEGVNTYKYRVTTSRYQDPLDLGEIGARVGYPLYLKPYDGAGGRGVSRVDDEQVLAQAYAESGQALLLAQAGAGPGAGPGGMLRTLGIGPQALTVRYDIGQPMHARYRLEKPDETEAREAGRIIKVINAFFLWDLNTCETIQEDGRGWLIDFANACPDMALTSLHCFFPGVLRSLLAWLLYCAVTDRPMRLMPDAAPYFAVADSARTSEEKMDAYERLADAHFTTKAFQDFCATRLQGLDECVREYARSAEFDAILVQKICSTFPHHEQEGFVSHYRHLIQTWAEDEAAQRR